MPNGKDYYNLYVSDKNMSWHKIADHFGVCMSTPWLSAKRYSTKAGLPWPPCEPEDPRFKKSLDSKKTWRTRRANSKGTAGRKDGQELPDIAPGEETLDLDMLQW